MDSNDTLRAIRHEMEEQGIDLLLGIPRRRALHRKPNAVSGVERF